MKRTKRHFKKILAALIVAIMLIGVSPIGGFFKM